MPFIFFTSLPAVVLFGLCLSKQGPPVIKFPTEEEIFKELFWEENGFKSIDRNAVTVYRGRAERISLLYEADFRVEEGGASLFQPDTLISAQYFETFRRKVHLEPEKRLMLAVLEDAVACFQKHLLSRNGKRKALSREAEEWIMERNSDWLFSFENICEVLGFNPEYVRQGLLRWKETKLASCSKGENPSFDS